MQTNDWICNNNAIQMQVETLYVKKQLETNRKEISTLISSIWGKSISINPELKVVEKPTGIQENLPEVVQILCEDFRGEVVKVSKIQNLVNSNNQHHSNDETIEDKHDEVEEDEF